MSDSPKVEKLWRVAPAARKVGMPVQTLHSAVKQNRIDWYPSACGLPLLLLADVKAFNRKRVVRGLI